MMRAFHNDPAVRQKYLDRVEAHRKADELVHGQYWTGGRGCAVGCTIHSSDHRQYEAELGIPVEIAHLEDSLFERMPRANAQEWPGKFLAAIPLGADLSMVIPHFLYWVLGDEKDGVIALVDPKEFPECHAAVASATALQERLLNGEKIEDSERAEEADWVAGVARAAGVAWVAGAAGAAWVEGAAGVAGVAGAAGAARVAGAAWAGRAARAAWAAWAAEYEKRALLQSEKLLELLAAAPIPDDARCETAGGGR